MKTEFSEVESSKNIFEAFFKALVNCFNFKGRTSRYDYWGFSFINFGVHLLFSLLGILAVRISTEAVEGVNVSLSIYSILILIPWFAAMVRRLHDTGRSALKWLLVLPLIGTVILFVIGILLKTKIFVVWVSFAILMYVIALSIVLCFRGSEKDNKYGQAVAEDSEQRWKGLAMPVFMVLVPIIVAIFTGVLSGYSRVHSKYRIQNVVPVMYDVLAEAKGYKTGTPIADIKSSYLNPQSVGIFRVSPEGGKIKASRVGNMFIITHSEVPSSLCHDFSNYNWTEHPDFESFKIEDGRDCQSCTENAPCTLIWNYK